MEWVCRIPNAVVEDYWRWFLCRFVEARNGLFPKKDGLESGKCRRVMGLWLGSLEAAQNSLRLA